MRIGNFYPQLRNTRNRFAYGFAGKLSLAAMLICLNLACYGQVSSYTFSSSTGTYTPLVGGTPMVPPNSGLSGVGWFEQTYNVPLPFVYYFNGAGYSSVFINSNGYLTFGKRASVTNPRPYLVNDGESGAIMGYGCGTTYSYAGGAGTILLGGLIDNSNSNPILYSTIGTAPNRIFVVQWTNADRSVNYYGTIGAAGESLTFQIRLSEGTNLAELVYNGSTTTYSPPFYAVVGLSGASNTDFNVVGGTDWTTATNSTVTTTGIPFTAAVSIPAGTTYDFTPPAGMMPTACTGTPAAPTALCDAGIACGAVNLSLAGLSLATGLTYQWQQSSTSLTNSWSNISGATNATLNTTPTAATYYKCLVTCGASQVSSSPVAVGYESSCPALPSYTYAQEGGFPNCNIGQFQIAGGACGTSLNDISNSLSGYNFATYSTGGGVANTYIDYTTNATHIQLQGAATGTPTFTATVNNYGGTYASVIGVWIDLNDNGSFDDANEYVGSVSGVDGTATAFTLTLPANNFGIHRMRVRTAASSLGYTTGSITPTGALSYFGQANDYVVEILPPTPSPTNNSPVCVGGVTTLSSPALAGGIYTWTGPQSYYATTSSATQSYTVTTLSSAGVFTLNTTVDGSNACSSATTAVTTFAPPTITSVSAPISFPTTSIVLTGTNFNTTAANDYVFFGGERTSVTAATATALTVNVPFGATYAPIVVESNTCGLQGSSPLSFLQTYNNAPYIAGIVNLDPKTDFNTGTSPAGTAIADIDGDGKPDMIVANYTSNTISVYRNTSTSGTITTGSFAPAVTYTTGLSPMGVAVGDLDGDGRPEIVVTNLGANNVSVFRNTSTSGVINSGSLALKADFPTGVAPEGVAIGDIDGDGKAEIIVANETGNNISVLMNTSPVGSISFAAKVDFATGSFASVVAVGDIDGDGRTDIAVTNFNATNISVLRNTATPGIINSGSLATHFDFTTGSNPHGLALADINGDGKPELVVTNYGSNTISIFQNNATSGIINAASFAARVNFGTLASSPFSLSVGDLDGDGKADIAVGYNGGSQLSVYRNNSSSVINSSSLALEVDFTTGGTPRNVAVGDLDLDGLSDVISANYAGNTISVLRNDPLKAITGNMLICQNGPTTTLSEPARGGTWISGTPSVATVGSTTGIVSGITAGTALISYIVPGGNVTAIVTVNPAPDASFTVTPNPVCFGTPSLFSNSASSITNYAWSFGDASTSSLNSISHTYATPGTFTATLTVTHTNGCLASHTTAVTVNPIPALSSTLTPTSICNNTVFNYTPTSAVPTTTFAWSRAVVANITNGAASGTNNPGETLSNTSANPVAVVYVYTLLANGCSNTQNVTVSVNPTPVLTSPLAMGAICNNTTFTYTPTSATTAATFLWYRAPVTGISNPAMSGGNGVSEVLINTTPNPLVVNYAYTLGINGCSNVQNVTVTVDPTPVLSNTAPAGICNNTVFNYTPASATTGTTFAWSRALVAGITNGPATGFDNPGETLANTTPNPLVVTYVYTLTANSCSKVQNVAVSVNPTPALSSSLAPGAICNNTLFNYTATSATTSAAFNWSRAAVTGIVNAASTGSNNIAETLINATPGPLAVTYVYSVSINGCTNTQNVVVTVNPTPMLSSALTPPSICNNTVFNYTPTSLTTGTTFAWGRSSIPGISNPSATGFDNPGETLVNTTANPLYVAYVYTLTANGCKNTQVVSVSVNPTPVLSSVLNAPGICNNTEFDYTPTSATTSATFAWSRATVAGISNSAATGTDNPGEILVNTTGNPLVVAYSYTLAINGCTNTQTVTVSVNPTPLLNSALTLPAICNNTEFDYTPTSATTAVTFDWSRPAVTGISNPAASGSDNPGEVLVNTFSVPIGVTYTYTLTINGCTNLQYVTVTVNPTPSLNSPTPPAICNNTVFSYTPTSLTSGTTFLWSRDAVTGISNAAASGSGNPGETLVNTTADPVAAIYVYTLTANGCSNIENVIATVNPTPMLSSSLTPPAICDSSTFSYTPTSATTGTTFEWTRAAVTGIVNPDASGMGDPAEQLINTTTSPIAVTYVYSLTANGCGNTQNVVVTVNPTPLFTSPLTAPAICDSTTFDYTPESGVTGTAFAWSRAAVTGIANDPATGIDNPDEQLFNTTSDPVAAIYTYTLTANGCSNMQNVTVTVNPTPLFTSALTMPAVCDSSTFNYTPASATTGTTFAWSRAAITGLANAAASGLDDPAEQLIDTTANPIVVIYTYTLTANGCSNMQNVAVTVNPTPMLTSTLTPSSICDSTLFDYTPTSATAGTVFSWSRAAITGITNPAASGADDPLETLENTTPDPITVTYTYTLTANGCSNVQNVAVVVNPKPLLVTSAHPAFICDNTSFIYVASSLTAGTVINWSRDTVAGIADTAASGIDSVNEVLSNITTGPIVVTYVNVLTANGCSNTAYITVTVEPLPVLNTPLTPPAICDSTLFTYTPGSDIAGTTFTWHRPFVPGILLLSGSGVDGISETLVSSTPGTKDVIYNYTLTANGCSNTQAVTVTVNPKALLSSGTTFGICDSAVFHYTPGSGTSGTTYAWVRHFVPGIMIAPGTGVDGISDTLINSTNVNVDMMYTYTLTANGCSDSEHVIVTVHPTPTLNTPTAPPAVCSGLPFDYTPGSNTPGTTYTWSRGTSGVIVPATGSGSGDITETLTNTTSTAQQVIYIVSLTANGCTHNEDVFVTVRTRPNAPVITTASPASVCDNTLNQNFGAASAPVPGETFGWTATGATVMSQGYTGQYCIVDFNAPGTAVITLTATIDSTGCVSDTSYTVSVGSAGAAQPYVTYAGGEFICLENDVTSYQWGYDNRLTLDSTILVGEINQAYVNGSPDTIGNFYWVITQSGDCMSKAYYNAPLFSVGVSNINNGSTSINVYPNPTSDYVNVDVTSTVDGNVSVKVLDMLGQEIATMPALKNKAVIDASKLAAGMYVVDCYRDGIKIGTAKFIKN